MTKEKAKLLVAELVERDLRHEVVVVGANDYKVTAFKPEGAGLVALQAIETALGITGKATRVEFT